ncbi:MAG: DUF5620 domain-containing protein [Porcipelethomonas sp.]
MGLKKVTSRLKAVVVSAAMLATTLITPAVFSSLSTVTAAEISVNKTLIADGKDGVTETSQKNTKVPVTLGSDTTKLTFNFDTDYVGSVTVGVSGAEINKDPWWVDFSNGSMSATSKGGSFSVTYTIPSTINKDEVKAIDVGIWYPKENQEFKLVSVTTDGSSTGSSTEDPNLPVSENDKSGSYSFTDNKDGTATIKSTLSAQVDDENMDYILTQGYDEESYIIDGKNTWTEDDPINSHKFAFTEFGIGDLTGVTFQSFEYIIECDYNMTRFMYGGGINVEQGSIADTEAAKGKDGFWYNDQGEEDVEKYGDKFQIDDYHGGYNAENAGKYAKVVWDVPKSVQPYVTTNGADSVGFQFWYGTTDEEVPTEATEEDAASGQPNEIKEVHLKGATCTYTRTATVPYNKTITKSVNKSLQASDDATLNQYKYTLTDLGLGERDLLSAVKFTLSASTDIGKFVGGLGISVDQTNPAADDGWYQPGNIVVLDAGKTIELMWIIPETIRKDVTTQLESGNVMMGFWYGENAESLTLKNIDFYVYESQEAELKVEPAEVTVAVDETIRLDINVDGCTIVPSAGGYIIINEETGEITGVKEGLISIEVTSPEGQSVRIPVEITAAKTTTVVTTKTTTTTTTVTTTAAPPTTTVNPDDVIDWDKVMYGDVDLNGKINVADVVTLNKYLLDKDGNPLNATARENADCEYDHALGMADAGKIINFLAKIIPQEELGDPDFYK